MIDGKKQPEPAGPEPEVQEDGTRGKVREDELKRVHRSTMQKRRKPISPVQGDSGTSGGVSPALEGLPPPTHKESMEDPIADWPETETAADQWLTDRGRPEDPADR